MVHGAPETQKKHKIPLFSQPNHAKMLGFSAHAMGAHERGGQGCLRYQGLETVHENDTLELPLDWWPKPRHAGEALAWSARISPTAPTHKPTRPDGGHAPESSGSNTSQESDAWRAYYLAMARGVRARRASAAPERAAASARDTTSQSGSSKTSGPAKTTPPAEQPRIDDRRSSYYLAMARSIRARQTAAAAERDGASARDTTSDSSKPSALAKTTPPEQHRTADLCAESPPDGRPVRGIVTIQAHPSHAAGAKSVLLVVSRGTLLVQTLQKPYRQLLELPLGDVAARVVPGHANMFRVTTIGSNPDAAAVVVLSDCSLRDRWLQALVTAGARVDVAGSCLTASTGKTSYPDAPVRWLR